MGSKEARAGDLGSSVIAKRHKWQCNRVDNVDEHMASMADVNKLYIHTLQKRAAEQRAAAKKSAASEAVPSSSRGIVAFLASILMHILMALHLMSANTHAEREMETHAPATAPDTTKTVGNESAYRRSWGYIHGAYECMGEGDLELYTAY